MTNDELLARPRFELEGQAELKHLNIRKEGPDDAKVLVVDAKLEIARVPGAALCRYFEPHLLLFLWKEEAREGSLMLAVRNPRVAPVEFLNVISGASVLIGGLQFHGCEMKRFSLLPHDGGKVTVGCSVTISGPSVDSVAMLARAVQDKVQVLLEAAPDLFDPAAKPAKPKSAKEAASLLQTMVAEDGTTVTVVANGRIESGDAVALDGKGGATSYSDSDPLLPAARDLVRQEKRASISMVQRHLKVGYGRASKLLEALERAGVVSVMDEQGRREVIVSPKLRTDAAWPFPRGDQQQPPA